MANDMDMWRDITELLLDKETEEQGGLLLDLYHYRYLEYNYRKIKKLKKIYTVKYGFVDNYI